MSIRRGQGDSGHTDSGGARVRKDAPAQTALGTLDELNAAVGLCLAEANRINHIFIRESLLPVQSELLNTGVDLAAILESRLPQPRLAPEAVARLDRDIDTVGDELPKLKSFILPGGSELAARLHAARTVARRAERAVVTALEPEPGDDAPVLTYLNRLSDLLFVLARLANADSGEGDTTWP